MTIYEKKRKELNKTQGEVAIAVGLSLAGYRNIEKGFNKPNPENEKKINKFLKIKEAKK